MGAYPPPYINPTITAPPTIEAPTVNVHFSRPPPFNYPYPPPNLYGYPYRAPSYGAPPPYPLPIGSLLVHFVLLKEQ